MDVSYAPTFVRQFKTLEKNLQDEVIEKNESPEEALKREIKEELDFIPEHYEFLGVYEFEREDTRHVYLLEVQGDFESTITVLEGECGRYFSEKEVLGESKIIGGDKVILEDVFSRVRNRI